MNEKEYLTHLGKIVKQYLQPLRNIPFNLVIEAISGHKVVPFNKDDDEDRQLLNLLKKAVNIAGQAINKKGIERRRPNEVGNDVESFVSDALRRVGLSPQIPRTRSGRRKSAGYPDLQIEFQGKVHYIECKTYNEQNVNTTQRSFYFSPSEDLKVTASGHHFALCFETYPTGPSKKAGFNIYKVRSWKILSLERLLVDVKHEFNSDNKRLYSGKDRAKILASGDFKTDK